jgi:glycerate dehydrogenase
MRTVDHPYPHSKHPERIFLTPHIAWYSREARARLAHEMAENIRKGW